MKNFLFAFFAFANLIASGMAGPVGKEDAGLEARESHDYSNHKQAVHNLLQDVLLQTGQMNQTVRSASNSLLEEDRNLLAKQVDEHVRSITQLLNKARSTKVNLNKRDALESREEICSQECIYEMVYALVYEIACTIDNIISKLGIEAVFDYLTPMIMALVQLLAYWDMSVVGLVIAVKGAINGLFVSIGITIIAIV